MEKKIRNIVYENFDIVALGITFLFWLYVFNMMPPICDRWMEGIAYYSIEDPWRYLFAQVRWIQNANARILSNLFSAIVDKNIFIRAIINSLMLLLTINDIREIVGKNKKNKYEIIIILSCLTFFSWGIKKEIYLYATTLYVSSVFLMIRVVKYLLKAFDDVSVNFYKLYILEFCASVWLENISVSVVTVSLFLLLVYYIKNKKIQKELFIGAVVSLIGLLAMYLPSKIATEGRLQGNVTIHLNWNRLFQLIYDNIGLFILMSVLMCVMLVKFRHESGTRYFNYIQILMWTIISGLEIILGSKHIYSIISSNPKNYEYVKLIFGWSAFQSEIINSLYDKLFSFALMIFPFVFIAGVILYIYCMKLLKERIKGLIFFLIFISGILIDVFGMQEGNRISYPGIFAVIGEICLLLKHLDKVKKTRIYIICTIVFIFSIINSEQLIMTVHEAHNIEVERTSIANLVRDKQRLEEWDYNEYVTMPKYDEEKIFGEERLQPKESDVYYDILLKYYGLNKETKINFKSQQE